MITTQLRACHRGLWCLLLSLLSLAAISQDGLSKVPNTFVNSNCNGYLQYLPGGYTANPGNKYPLMIYFTGLGNNGDGSVGAPGPNNDVSLATGLERLFTFGGTPHDQVRSNSWVEQYTVNGVPFKFVIFTPQFKDPLDVHLPTPAEVDTLINYAISHFNIDTSRIYLVGASQGAGSIWDYVGAKSAYARRIAAIVPFAGVSFPVQSKANIMKYNKVAVWGLQNLYDDQVPSWFTNDYVDYYNNPPQIGIPAKKTMFNSGGHQCWPIPLQRQYTENGKNVYEWMLQYKTDPSKAFAGEDQEILAPTGSVQLQATGTAANGTVVSYQWSKLYGPTGTVNFSSSTIANPVVSNLAQGTYVFQANINGTSGSVATDYVAVTVNPPQQRIEAESFTNAPQVVVATFNGVVRVDQINWLDTLAYNVNIPFAGLYRLRFHVGTSLTYVAFDIVNSNNVNLGTVDVFPLAGAYVDRFKDVFLDAGQQTLRLANRMLIPYDPSNPSLADRPWYMDWFDVIQPSQAQYPLPVSFSLFNANCSNNAVELLWKTSGESATKSYTIEKSGDGRAWNQLASLPASKEQSDSKTYKYIDNSGGNTSLYRIVEESFDGRKSYTSIMKGSCSEKSAFTVFPNPVTDKAVISLNLDRQTRLELSILDSKGAGVKKQTVTLPPGNNQLPINFSSLPSGIYTIVANWDGEARSVRIVKK